MQIEVTGTVQVRNGVSQAGKKWEMREQEAYMISTVEKYPRKTKVNVPDEMKDGYPLGKYEVDWDKTITVGEYDRLTIGRSIHLSKKVA